MLSNFETNLQKNNYSNPNIYLSLHCQKTKSQKNHTIYIAHHT